MKVILNDYVEHLGERGDAVAVKPGYARNYLIPKGLAYPDTPGNRKRFAQEQKRWEDMDLGRRSAAEKVAQQLVGTELVFERRAGEKDVLFGSVSVLDIAREIQDRGLELDKRKIQLAEPIKELGSFQVEIEIHREVRVTIPVHVVRPGGQPEPEEAEVLATTSPEEVSAAELVEAALADPAPAPSPEPEAADEPAAEDDRER